MSAREVSPETRQLVRAAISDAFYGARNDGRTMEDALDEAVVRLEPILLSVDENAHRRGAAAVREGGAS